jgi:hypothetical protein
MIQKVNVVPAFQGGSCNFKGLAQKYPSNRRSWVNLLMLRQILKIRPSAPFQIEKGFQIILESLSVSF